MRSRVTPGLSCTTASRRPRMRFTRVDLPTLGLPTTASTGCGGSAPVSSGWPNSSSTAVQSDSSAQVPSSSVIALLIHFTHQVGQVLANFLSRGDEARASTLDGQPERLPHQNV